MNLESLEAFAMSISVIISLLVERAGRVKILATPKAKFVAPGVLALVVVVTFWLAMDPRPPVYVPLVKWLGLWGSTFMAHTMLKDYGQKPPDRPAT